MEILGSSGSKKTAKHFLDFEKWCIFAALINLQTHEIKEIKALPLYRLCVHIIDNRRAILLLLFRFLEQRNGAIRLYR